ncbi:type II secretion system secretin GspD [Maricaulis sp.]|uniref:type II secretion system secretin GspD n=1 Tax=Maricaulis sp. TaxID=1486257 RepID=UPI00262A6BD8|nr:type II secretion system secretin GspD [Maricaulis sp.]
MKIYRYYRGLAAALSALALSGCATGLSLPGTQQAVTPMPTRPAASAPAPEPASPVPAAAQPEAEPVVDPERLVFYQERNARNALSRRGGSALDERTMRLEFVDAPVVDAVRAIIEEALGQPVMVATGVEGRITLTAAEPTSVRTALTALETVLSESGYALVERESGFLLTQSGEVRANLSGSGQIGYGGLVLPIEHTDPSAILTLIDPFLSTRIQAVPRDEEGVLVLAGPASEVRAAQDAVRTFDRPFLTDRVFGMYELRFVNASAAKTEVDAVLTGMGMASGAVRTIALPRPNLLFVAARDRSAFEQVRELVERFDTPSGGDERRLRYYTARNAPAATLASQITAAFAGGAAGDGAVFQSTLASERSASAGEVEDEGPEGRLAIIPDQLNNALIIRATDQEYREILELLDRMDVMPPQVLIEATIAEVRLVDGLNFGVRWFFESQSGDGTSNISFTDSATGSTSPTFPGFNYAFTGADLTATLSALNSLTDVTVLSAPSIMVQNNQTANLRVGDEVPIVTQTASAVTDPNAPLISTIEMRDTGVILEVTPRINASGVVVLEVDQEVSSVRPTTTSGIDSPTIQTLEFTSTVAVRSERTIALGGLIRESHSDNESGIPLLSRIPGVGNAFKDRALSSERSELVIFLTPRIIENDQDAEDALSHMRRELEALEARQPDLFD